jgi:hypothetical protein
MKAPVTLTVNWLILAQLNWTLMPSPDPTSPERWLDQLLDGIRPTFIRYSIQSG